MAITVTDEPTWNDGKGHGPYLYWYYREEGLLTSEYVGKA